MNYRVMYKIDLKHQYFKSLMCEGLHFQPTAETIRQAQNTGVIFKPYLGGVGVLYDLDKLKLMMLHASDSNDPLVFDFMVTSYEPNLSDYSSISLSKENKIVMLSNRLTNDKLNLIKGDVVLHQQEYISEEDFLSLDELKSEDIAAIKISHSKVVFFISIHINEKLLDIISNDAFSNNKFNLIAKVDNRKSYWEYRVYGGGSENFDVVDINKSIFFETKSIDISESGEQMAIFRSHCRLELKQFSEHHFQLVDKREKGNKVVIHHLPAAQAGKGYQESIDTKLTQISEIFVNF